MPKYSDRLSVLNRVYKRYAKDNELYLRTRDALYNQQRILKSLYRLQQDCRIQDSIITKTEKAWRESILNTIEKRICYYLSIVYPTDGYTVDLDFRILRGKIKISATASSIKSGSIAGRINKTQGRLFQQVVSFASIVAIMELQGVKTIVIDEAFSGSSPSNVPKLRYLFDDLIQNGFSFIVVAQDTEIKANLNSHIMFLSRDSSNETVLKELNVNEDTE